ncbi:MAG: hypothetical protein OXC83_12255 [Chloroflexi bacterium]|nr:hypothetical protein [Chloroflexota bacterium]
MEIARRIVAVFLIATAIAVVVNLAATPLYHDGSADYTVWEILNYFMAVGTVIVLVVGILRKRAIGGTDVDTLTYLRTSVVFYGGIVLASLFFWEWFWQLNPDSETGDAVTSHLIYFPIVDMMYAVLALIVGRRIWSGGTN